MKEVKDFPKRAIHLDFHTMPGIYDVGRDFDGHEFAETLSKAGVDYITVFAKCNLGFAYYPTEVGIVHPGLKIDLLGQMVEACHRRDIRVAAYFNAGIDHEHSLRHRDWCKVSKTGQVYKFNEMGHWFRNPCLNTGHADYLLAMVRETLTRYPVDGIFLDCFDLSPCYGMECIDGMRALDMDPNDDIQAAEHCRIVTYKFLDAVEQEVSELRPGINVYFNGIAYRRQPTHIELEVLPTGGWGYDYLPAMIRYARTLGKPYFTMTGRFHESWGDFGGIRTEHSLLFDCYYSLANGGTYSIGDHMHPRGQLDRAVYDLIGRVYTKMNELRPWSEGARPITDIVVIDPRIGRVPEAHPAADEETLSRSVIGAARMLDELNCQFDVSDGDFDYSPYQVMILPDSIRLEGNLLHSVREFLDKGGQVISSAFSGMSPEQTGRRLTEYDSIYDGSEPWNMGFLKALSPVDADMPDLLTAVYETGVALTASHGGKALAELYQPYFNKQSWDWRHENLYVPPEKDAGRPAVAQIGSVIHFAFPLFESYYERAPIPYRTLLRNCLDMVLPRPVIRVENLPSFGRATITEKGNERMVYLLSYVPELRGRKMQAIEEPVCLRDVRVSLRADSVPVQKVYLAPSGTQLGFTQDSGYTHVTVPEVNGYQLVVFDLQGGSIS